MKKIESKKSRDTVPLRNNLESFGAISGPNCNFDKTVVMPVGANNVIPKNLNGFLIAQSIKLLDITMT
jgi:hypothetical protein